MIIYKYILGSTQERKADELSTWKQNPKIWRSSCRSVIKRKIKSASTCSSHKRLSATTPEPCWAGLLKPYGTVRCRLCGDSKLCFIPAACLPAPSTGFYLKMKWKMTTTMMLMPVQSTVGKDVMIRAMRRSNRSVKIPYCRVMDTVNATTSSCHQRDHLRQGAGTAKRRTIRGVTPLPMYKIWSLKNSKRKDLIS